LPKSSREVLRCLLTAAVAVGIKGQIDRTGSIANLVKLTGVEMRPQGAGNVAKTGLP
jgi:hypothetical protein